MLDLKFYNRYHQEVTFADWLNLARNKNYCIIAKEVIEPGLEVSTVWIPAAATSVGPHDPLMSYTFETMVFDSREPSSVYNGMSNRYPSMKDARAGHKRMVKYLNDKTKDKNCHAFASL